MIALLLLLAAADPASAPISLAPVSLAPPAPYKGGHPGKASIIGRVVLQRLPQPKKFQVTKYADKCGREKADPAIVFSNDKGLKNVVVWIEGVREGKDAPKDTVALKNITCMYEPRVSVAVQGATLELKNYDGTQMNATAFLRPLTTPLFSAALPVKGLTHRRKLTELGMIDLRADSAQPWVAAFVWVFDHPYATVSDDGGYFSIEKLPAGRVTVHAWHEVYGEKSQVISLGELGSDQPARVDFEL